MSTERVILIDGTGLVYRAWHALPRGLKTTGGLHTNAVFGFAQMFRKILAGKAPTYGAVVFDAPGPTFRKAVDPNYKAHRPAMPDALRAQLPWIDTLVEAHNIPILRVEGVEADDVIGTLTHRALAGGFEVWIVSGDKDFAQLVTTDRVRLFDSTREVVYDAERVFKRWGVRPDQFVDWLALVGDRADNIPGVRGIGKKGAAQLLATHGTLDALLENPAMVGGRMGRALRDQAQIALRSRELATLRTDLPLEIDLTDLTIVFPTPAQLDEVYRELEFHSLLSAAPAAEDPDLQYFVCDTAQSTKAALRNECGGPEPVAVVALTEFPSPRTGDLAGIALSPRPGFALYFPLRGPGRVLCEEGLLGLRSWLEDPQISKVAHDGKGVWVALRRAGIHLAGMRGDTALASYLVDPTRHLPHRIEQVAREYIQRGLMPVRNLVGGGRRMKRFDALTVDKAGAWACYLADAVRCVWPELEDRLRMGGQWQHLAEVDLPLAVVLGQMELDGIAVDSRPLRRLGEQFETERDAVLGEIHRLAGRVFNPGSHKQLGEVLFEELGLPILGRTKTGYRTTSEVLDRLASSHPIIDKIRRWRTLARLVHSSTRALLEAIEEDGRIHPTYQQTVSASGRLISTEPDLQRTPVRTAESRQIRTAFVAAPDHRLVSADWSQIELRLVAHFSEDDRLVEAYQGGLDVHVQTAATVLGIRPGEVSATQRSLGKQVNFATLYGQGARALAEQLGIDRAQANDYISSFFEHYQGVRAWRDRVVHQAYVDGYVTTLMGRRRYLPELSSNNWNDRAHGERIAMNTPIQGSAADLCKVALLRVSERFHRAALSARLVLQIHDEFLVDCPRSELEAVQAILREEMTGAASLKVPLVVDVGVGDSWADAH